MDPTGRDELERLFPNRAPSALAAPPDRTSATVVHLDAPAVNWGKALLGVACGVGVGLLLGLSVALARQLGLTQFWALVAGIGVWTLMVAGVIRVAQQRMTRCLESVIADMQHKDLAESLPGRLGIASLYLGQVSRKLTRGMVRTGLINRVICVAPPRWRLNAAPLNVDFEARLLDETQPGFAELLHEGNGEAGAPGGASLGAPRRPRNYVERTVTRNGGMFALVIFLILAALAAVESYRRGVVTSGLMIWLSASIAWLLIPGSALRLRRCEWLVVPGGLLVRSAGWRDPQWTLHLFDRARGVLLLTRARLQTVWQATVADETAVQQSVLTDAEAELLLRAWTSPIPPPPMERLAELKG